MSKKSSKTTHVLSLLTNMTPDIEEEIDVETLISHTLDDPSTPVPIVEAQGTSPQPLTIPPAQSKLERSIKNEFCEEGLSEIIKAQLELITEKEEDEAAAMVSSLNLEYFDEEEESSMYHYANVVEDIVKIKVLETMKEMCSCTCDKCVSDVIAHALNNLPPKYVVTEKGNLFSKLAAYENQYSADVTAAIVQACLVINENPRH